MVRKSFVVLLKKYKKLILLFLLVLLTGFFFYKKLIIFAIILAISTMLQFITYNFPIRFNFGHVFFLSALIMRNMGILYAVLLILITEFYPRLSKSDIDAKSLIIVPLEIVFIYMFKLFDFNIVLLGIILSIVYYLLSSIIAKAVGENKVEIAMELGLPFFINLICFISLSSPLINLLGMVVR